MRMIYVNACHTVSYDWARAGMSEENVDPDHMAAHGSTVFIHEDSRSAEITMTKPVPDKAEVVETYQTRAKRCEKRAREAVTLTVRERFLDLATQWRNIAADFAWLEAIQRSLSAEASERSRQFGRPSAQHVQTFSGPKASTNTPSG
jgi:hypothetical protein